MTAAVRDRVVDLRRVRAGDLVPNDRNWRQHPDSQRDAIRAILGSIGYVGALVARPLPDGRLQLLDGHMRASIDPGAIVPVLVVDLNDEEAAKVLATFDPVGGMANNDGEKLRDLLLSVQSADGLDDLLADLRAAAEAPYTLASLAMSDLKAHQRNYREHPDDQIEHLMASIKEYGVYRRVVVARDNTILAGHGVVRAAERLGVGRMPVVRLNLDPLEPSALKLLALDNEVAHFAEFDDRALTELLKEILATAPDGLLGTGFDEQQLCALVYTTRPEKEIADKDDSAEWLGLPEYTMTEDLPRLVITFETSEARQQFVESIGLEVRKSVRKVQSASWPNKPRAELAHLEFAEAAP